MTKETLSADKSTVFVVDSDPREREKISRLARSMRLEFEAFQTGLEFLQAYDPSCPGCLVTEVRTPEIGGIAVQRALASRQIPLPVIFLSQHAAVPVVVQAMQYGAINFLEKPANEQHLWESIQEAVQEDKRRRRVIREEESRINLVAQLEPHEQRMIKLIGQGAPLRDVAECLGVSVRTIELRRGRLMQKLNMESHVELLKFAFSVLDAGEDFNASKDDDTWPTSRSSRDIYRASSLA